jgi:hypothetical protein
VAQGCVVTCARGVGASLSFQDWNSTPDAYRTASIAAAGGNTTLGKAQYEAAAKAFMLGTIRAVRGGGGGAEPAVDDAPCLELCQHPSVTPAQV